MSKLVYTDARIFVGAADLSGVSNKAELSAEREAKDVTNFRSAGWKESIAGLGSASINAEGFWEAGGDDKVDNAAWDALGGVGAWTVCPSDATDGAKAFFTKALEASYTFLGAVGDVAPYKAMGQSSWPLVKGVIANPPGSARTSTGTGTAVELGAVEAGQSIYAALHVLSVSGTSPSITFAVESDEDGDMASPVSRISFSAATDVGSQILRTAGAITDTFWRAKWTVSGTTPSFLAVVAIGIA